MFQLISFLACVCCQATYHTILQYRCLTIYTLHDIFTCPVHESHKRDYLSSLGLLVYQLGGLQAPPPSRLGANVEHSNTQNQNSRSYYEQSQPSKVRETEK